MLFIYYHCFIIESSKFSLDFNCRLVAAKTYYFGVGGSTRQFEKLIAEMDVFNVEVVWKCSEGKNFYNIYNFSKNISLATYIYIFFFLNCSKLKSKIFIINQAVF